MYSESRFLKDHFLKISALYIFCPGQNSCSLGVMASPPQEITKHRFVKICIAPCAYAQDDVIKLQEKQDKKTTVSTGKENNDK